MTTRALVCSCWNSGATRKPRIRPTDLDRLYQERLARLVLDRLLDSGELRSVESQRALSLRMCYLPPMLRLEVPAEDDFLPLLDPNRREQAADGLRRAILRVVRHEESDHWVVVDPALDIDVRLREGTRRVRVTPVYEPELEAGAADRVSLGEPRLRLGWGDGRALLFRQRQGLLKVDLGSRSPGLVVFEAPSEGPGPVAWLYATGPVDQWEDGRRTRHKARTRIPIERDLTLTLRPPWTRALWQRAVALEVEVLGLTRLGRPSLLVTSSDGTELTWDRNRQETLELGPDVLLYAGEHDRLRVVNAGTLPAAVRWFEGAPLEVPPGDEVVVQGAHFGGLTTPGGVTWTIALPEGVVAPPPRFVAVVGELVTDTRGTRIDDDGPSSLFRFESVGAAVEHRATILPRLRGDVAVVAVESESSARHLADLALDDCPGVKLRATPDAPWRQVTGVTTLQPSRARLEAISTPQILFEVPRRLPPLTTDPSDQLVLDGWRVGLSGDSLVIAGGGDHPIVVDGAAFEGPTRVPYRDDHQVRAGAGVYRIVRTVS